MTERILGAYGLNPDACHIEPFGTGLINHTWLVSVPALGKRYILQQVNDQVFRQPDHIAGNLRMLANHLAQTGSDYRLIAPLQANDGRELIEEAGLGWFRLMPFVEGSHAATVVHHPRQALEASRQFGRFTAAFRDFDAKRLHITIPHFHDLSFRYRQFELALAKAESDILQQAADAIHRVQTYRPILDVYVGILQNPDWHLRVTHHDTKISNVLLDHQDQGLCVIDLDTVMPGYYISDVGDMMRTYLSPANEETADWDEIAVRPAYFEALAEGYLGEMGALLSPAEQQQFIYAGKFMIYMQAIRFLTDFLMGDVYYGADYEGHNLQRATNQLILLDRLCEAEPQLNELLQPILSRLGSAVAPAPVT